MVFIATAWDVSQKPEEPFIDPINGVQMAENIKKIMEGKMQFPLPFDMLPWSKGNKEGEIRVLFQ